MMNRRDVLTGVIGVTGAAIVGLPVLAAAPVPLSHNDAITRAALKEVADRTLMELGPHEFATLCDETNNSPARVESGFIWLDTIVQRTRSETQYYVPFKVNVQNSLPDAKAKLTKLIQQVYADPASFLDREASAFWVPGVPANTI